MPCDTAVVLNLSPFPQTGSSVMMPGRDSALLLLPLVKSVVVISVVDLGGGVGGSVGGSGSGVSGGALLLFAAHNSGSRRPPPVTNGGGEGSLALLAPRPGPHGPTGGHFRPPLRREEEVRRAIG